MSLLYSRHTVSFVLLKTARWTLRKGFKSQTVVSTIKQPQWFEIDIVPRVTKHLGQDAAAKQDEFGVKPPSLSLPTGGGAIRGIGETFAANPVTGSATFSIPTAGFPE